MCLSACGGTSLRDAYALSQVDPATTEASALRVAVSVPDTIRPQSDGVQMIGNITPPGGQPRVHFFDLAALPLDQANLPGRPGMAQYLYRIAPDDLAVFDAFRTAARRNKAAGGKWSLTVNPPLCHTAEVLPDRIPLEILLKTAELDRFVTLTKVADMRDEISDGDLNTIAPPCP